MNFQVKKARFESVEIEDSLACIQQKYWQAVSHFERIVLLECRMLRGTRQILLNNHEINR
jgi:hypothetical protein